MEVQKEIDFLLQLDQKVTVASENIAVIGPLIAVLAMIKGRIQMLQQEVKVQPDAILNIANEVGFLLIVDDQVSTLIAKVVLHAQLVELIVMIKQRIQALEHEAEFHSAPAPARLAIVS